MAKKEARIARKHEKALAQQEKRARFVESVLSELKPRVELALQEACTPRAEQNPHSIMSMRMEFKIHDNSDRADSWSWGQARNWCGPEHHANNSCTVRATMLAMSALYWHEIHSQTTGGKERHFKHHSQSFSSICDEAQTRWVEIGREEDELFRFRTGGKERIWGYRTGHVFNVVWWDAHHMIYPVD